ncbi:MAG: Eco57I restriction-modification methylase domain-containing protein [Vampirovibrionia bacterium]|jgi:adenine-specific DNA-methyltransferase
MALAVPVSPSRSKAKELGQVFTPENICNLMVNLISKTSKKFLEPSAGEGVFVKALLERGYSDITAIEYDDALFSRLPPVIKNVAHNTSFIKYQSSEPFDCVIGNPPYIRWKNLPEQLKDEVNLLESKLTHDSLCDYSNLFILKAVELLREGGELIFITPEYWLSTTQSKKLRAYLLKHGYFERIIRFNETPIFKGVFGSFIIFKYIKHTRHRELGEISITQCLKKGLIERHDINIIESRGDGELIKSYSIRHFSGIDPWSLSQDSVKESLTKILLKSKGNFLKDVANIGNGLVSGCDRAFNIDNKLMGVLTSLEEKALVRVIKAKHIAKYKPTGESQYILLNSLGIQTERELIKSYPNFYNLLTPYKEVLEKRYSYNKQIPYWDWVFLRNYKSFSDGSWKIFVPCKERVTTKQSFRFCIAPPNVLPTQDVTCINVKHDREDFIYFLLGYLNSDKVFVWLTNNGIIKGDIVEFSEKPLANLPIPSILEGDSEILLAYAQIVRLVKESIEFGVDNQLEINQILNHII